MSAARALPAASLHRAPASGARWPCRILLLSMVLLLGACASGSPGRVASTGPAGIASGTAGPKGGGYYLDDGPGNLSPDAAAGIPDAVPRAEPVLERTSRPYTVFGRTYTPMTALAPYEERGVASWYGRRYHGRPTSSGEPYDMYAMTAAHPILPIPSYARVTRIDTGQSIVVRINDRGPFLQNRVIDLSWSGAARLGFVERGSVAVSVEAITAFDGRPERTSAAVPELAPAREPAPAPMLSARADESALPAGDGASQQRETSQQRGTSVFWLQFGAYGSAQNARAALERVRTELPWLPVPLTVRAEDELHKVQAGPWPGHESALEAAGRARGESRFAPYVVFHNSRSALADSRGTGDAGAGAE